MGYNKYETSSLTPVFIWNTGQNLFSRSKAVTKIPLFYAVHVVFHINYTYAINPPKICIAFRFEIHHEHFECILHYMYIFEGYYVRCLREQTL